MGKSGDDVGASCFFVETRKIEVADMCGLNNVAVG
jgi:hypothetical protein